MTARLVPFVAIVAFVALALAALSSASAQPQPGPGSGSGQGSGSGMPIIRLDRQPGEGPRRVEVKQPGERTQVPATVAAPHPGELHDDVVQGSSKWIALAFWAFALSVIGGAIFVITRRNLVAAVMGMVGTFFGLSAVYMMLYASFLAAIQLLVYAGAIMVLFVFVIMILNKPEDEPMAPVGMLGKGLAGLGLAYLLLRLVLMLWSVTPAQPKMAALAPRPVEVQIVERVDNVPKSRVEKYDFGSTRAVGTDLFTRGLFPFEAISILLLVGVVGAIAIARPLKQGESEGGEA
jgi:NADH-quinone oxidoreductase subunit J